MVLSLREMFARHDPVALMAELINYVGSRPHVFSPIDVSLTIYGPYLFCTEKDPSPGTRYGWNCNPAFYGANARAMKL